jgi:hypothetical protein
MRILLINGTVEGTDQFQQNIASQIDRLIKTDPDLRIGVLLPGTSSRVEISENNIVKFQVNSRGDATLQIPKLTPAQIREINNFISEFNPDIIHSHDEGFLALIAQFWAIRKKIPFLLSLGNLIEQENSLTGNIILKLLSPFGFNERFINNFYHNSTAIICNNEVQLEFIEKLNYKGRVFNQIKNHLTTAEIYQTIYRGQQEYIRSPIFSSITELIPSEGLREGIEDMLPERNQKKYQKSLGIKPLFWLGAAIVGSLVAYFGLKKNQEQDKKVEKNNK